MRSRSDYQPAPLSAAFMADIVGWDVRTWSRAVEFWQQAVDPAPSVLRCLELGAGPGGPSLWLALLGHDVLCSNQDNTASFAAPLHDRYRDQLAGSGGSIEYQDVNAREIGFENEFDIVVFKSVLGGLGDDTDQARAVAGILRALKPGGRLLFAENVRGTALHQAARSAMNRRRNANWRFSPVSRLHELLGGFSQVELHTTGVLGVFGVNEPQRRALAGADRALNRITPSRWRYMAYGVATK